MRPESERVPYTRYITTLVTRDKGTLVGQPDQWPDALVREHYGTANGLYPWLRDGIEYLVVTPGTGEQPVLVPGTDRIAELTSTRQVLDYVYALSQKAV